MENTRVLGELFEDDEPALSYPGSMRSPIAGPALLITGLLVTSCGGGNAASALAQPPRYEPKDQTKCGVEKSMAKPLIVGTCTAVE